MKVAETAGIRSGTQSGRESDALLTLLESGPKLLIVDLNARSQPIQVIERVRAGKNDVRVIGFMTHVQTDGGAGSRRGLRRGYAPFELHAKSGGDSRRREGLM